MTDMTDDEADDSAAQGRTPGDSGPTGTPARAEGGSDATSYAVPDAAPEDASEGTASVGRASSAADPSAAEPADADSSHSALPFPLDSLPDLRQTSGSDTKEYLDPRTRQSREEFTTVYDIIEQLEAMLDEAKSGLFTPGVVKVNREEFAGRLDELKAMLPVQLERASALMREAERRLESAQSQVGSIIAAAQSRAADMVKDANEQAQFLAGQENVMEIARNKARDMLDQAQSKSDRLTQGADRYSLTVMEGLQQQIAKLNRDVQAGIDVLRDRQAQAGESLPHVSDADYPQG